MKNIKAVIFDHDNTIAHTEPLWVQAVIEFLQERSITIAEYEKGAFEDELLGLGLVPIAQLLIKRFSLADGIDSIQANICEKIQRAYRTNLSFIPGFIEFFKRVQAAQLKAAIASNSDPDSLALAAQRLGLVELFGTHMYHAGHVIHPKPDPELYLLAASKLGVSPSECIAIEDSSHGIQAAQAAGMYCIGITTSGKRELVSNADLIVDSYNDIDVTRFI